MEGSTFSFTEIFGWITEGMKAVMSVATEFPLNIYVGAGIIGIGVGLYKALK